MGMRMGKQGFQENPFFNLKALSKKSMLQRLKLFGSFCLQWALQQKLELLVSIPLFNNNVGLFLFSIHLARKLM